MKLITNCACVKSKIKPTLILPCNICNGNGKLEAENMFRDEGGYYFEGTGHFTECFECHGSGNLEV